MSWENVVKSSDGYWKPEKSSWDFCGLCCVDDKKSVENKHKHQVYEKEKKISHHWTNEDDQKLLRLAVKYDCDWDTISLKFKDKTPGQLQRRWDLKVNPELKNRPWTDQEDILLRELVLKYGYDWQSIIPHFKGRNAADLSKRFDYSVLPKLTQQELIILQDLASPKTDYSMDIDSSLNDSNLSALQKRVEKLQVEMKETMEQIDKLESDMCDNNSLLD